MMPKVALLTIGDEILSGTTLDTNSNFIAANLIEAGFAVSEIRTVSDSKSAITNALADIFSFADIIIATGGLGPTKDDKTKQAVADFFDKELVVSPEAFSHLADLLERRNRSHLLEINRAQAEIPQDAILILNDYGTAACFGVEKNGKIMICLPGVPFEVKPMLKEKVIPLLQEKYQTQFILNRTVSVVDFPESLLSEALCDWEDALPPHITLSYLPIANRIKLKLTAKGENRQNLEAEMEALIQKVKPIIGSRIISTNGDAVEQILFEKLKEKNLSISTAESCTGGQIARKLTGISGISSYFPGGVVTYQTEQKIQMLQVSPETLRKHTVVSAEVAEEMVLGCEKLFGADISVSTTGVAGPSSDEYGNPVGLMFYAIRYRNASHVFKLNLPHLERQDFIDLAAIKVLQEVVILLQEA